MKKTLLQLVFVLLPFFALAQGDAQVYKEFNKKAWGITTSFSFNDHISIIQTQTEKETFELAALDNKMNVLWRNKFEGYPVGAGKFGDHILAISADKYKNPLDKVIGPFSAVLIDEKTGKEINKKIIYDSKSDIQEFPDCYFKGSTFTFIVWQAKHSSMMVGFRAVDKLTTIDGLSVVRLDANLNPTISKLNFPDEDIANLDCNDKGDVFLATHPRGANFIKVTKYEAPKYEVQESIVQNIDVRRESDLNYRHGVVTVSDDNRDVLFMAIMHANKGNDNELTLSKFDFGSKAVSTINETFDKQHVREIESAYVPFDNNLSKPDIGPSGLTEKYIKEWHGTLLVVMSESNMRAVMAGNSNVPVVEDSFVINGYDANLKTKFQQLMPTIRMSHTLSTRNDGNSFYMLASTFEDGKPSALFGQLDLSSGKWMKLRLLPKENLNKKAGFGRHIMWFADSFIIPYNESSSPVSFSNFSLQLNSY